MNRIITNPTVLAAFLGTFNRTASEDPIKAYNFLIEIDGFARFGFSKGTAPKVKIDEVEYREGGDAATPRKSPGLAKYENVTLERGVILAAGQGDADCLDWLKQVFDAGGALRAPKFRRNIEYVLLNNEGKEGQRWRLMQAWPNEGTPFSDLDGTASSDQIEKLTVCYEGLIRVKLPPTSRAELRSPALRGRASVFGASNANENGYPAQRIHHHVRRQCLRGARRDYSCPQR